MPAGRMGGALEFFRCAVGLSSLLARHDDYWISAYLRLQHNLTVTKVRMLDMRQRELTMNAPTSGAPIDKYASNAKGHRWDKTSLRDANDSTAVLAASAQHFEGLRNCTRAEHAAAAVT